MPGISGCATYLPLVYRYHQGGGDTVDEKDEYRLVDIETKLAHQEYVVGELNEALSDQQSRIAALEIMINTSAVANLIRQGKLDQLETAMQSGGSVGMQTMDSALMDLVDRAFVSGREAYQQANNKSLFRKIKNET